MEALAAWVTSARPLPGFSQVYAPGEIEEETRARRRAEGFEIPDATWEQIAGVAAEARSRDARPLRGSTSTRRAGPG